MVATSIIDKSFALDKAIDERITLARTEAYGKFTSCKSADDFYFDTLLNTFLSLVQYPLNFIIFDGDSSTPTPLFHFCQDIEHKSDFDIFIEGQTWEFEKLYKLFPRTLKKRSYYILPVFMQTKGYHLNDPFSAVWATKRKAINNKEDYISICTSRFFSDIWDAHETKFNVISKKCLEASLEKLEINSLEAFNDNGVTAALKEINFPNKVKRGRWKGNDWKEVLQKVFMQGVTSTHFGLDAISGLLHEEREKIPLLHNAIVPPNILIGFRAFTRSSGQERFYQEARGGYAHDTAVLVPVSDEETGKSPYSEYFQYLRDNYGGSRSAEYEDASKKRCLYSNLLEKELESLPDIEDKKPSAHCSTTLHAEKVRVFSKFSKEIDRAFWDLLSKKKGVEQCLKILAQPYSANVRSLFDPVFSTGLIHYNKAYEYAGLDRIDFSIFKNNSSFESCSKVVKNDMLRISITYYLLAGMAASIGIQQTYSPRNLGVILVPVKMIGSVWSVCAHATYFNNDEDLYVQKKVWLSSFLLTTHVRRNNYRLFDKLLWSNVEDRVRTLLTKEIGNATVQTFEDALNNVNRKLSGEQRLVPYALPQFWFTDKKPSDENEWYQKFSNKDGISIFICWKIKRNPFFVARQKWSGKGTRTFHRPVYHGVIAGLDLMRQKLR